MALAERVLAAAHKTTELWLFSRMVALARIMNPRRAAAAGAAVTLPHRTRWVEPTAARRRTLRQITSSRRSAAAPSSRGKSACPPRFAAALTALQAQLRLRLPGPRGCRQSQRAQIPDDVQGYPLDLFTIPRHYEKDLESIIIPHGVILDRIEKLAHDIFEEFQNEPLTVLCVLKVPRRHIVRCQLTRCRAGTPSSRTSSTSSSSSTRTHPSPSRSPSTSFGANSACAPGPSPAQPEELREHGVDRHRAHHWSGGPVVPQGPQRACGGGYGRHGPHHGQARRNAHGAAARKAAQRVPVCQAHTPQQRLPPRVFAACTRCARRPRADIGFEVPDKFIVGYALDYNEHFRDLNVCVSFSGLGLTELTAHCAAQRRRQGQVRRAAPVMLVPSCVLSVHRHQLAAVISSQRAGPLLRFPWSAAAVASAAASAAPAACFRSADQKPAAGSLRLQQH